MTINEKLIAAEWEPDLPLPTKADFVNSEDDLDGQHSWKQFGGLTRTEAYERFLKLPHVFQEDFMFMGTAAFVYYYPVIERFLFETIPNDKPDDREAWILAEGIMMQLDSDASKQIVPLYSRIEALADFVCNSINLFSDDEQQQHQIADAWRALKARIWSNPK